MRGPGVDGLCVTIRGDEITADAEAMAFLNGERIRGKQRLKTGDRIVLGYVPRGCKDQTCKTEDRATPVSCDSGHFRDTFSCQKAICLQFIPGCSGSRILSTLERLNTTDTS